MNNCSYFLWNYTLWHLLESPQRFYWNGIQSFSNNHQVVFLSEPLSCRAYEFELKMKYLWWIVSQCFALFSVGGFPPKSFPFAFHLYLAVTDFLSKLAINAKNPKIFEFQYILHMHIMTEVRLKRRTWHFQSRSLTLEVPRTKIFQLANSIDLDEGAQNEPPHLVVWLVVLGLTRLYFSQYRAVSQRDGERKEKWEMRINMF